MKVYIGLGSNIGEREAYLMRAVRALQTLAGPVTAMSSIRETAPYGGVEQNCFLNAVVAVETMLSPGDLLKVCKTIERRLDRVETVRWGPRTIDLDILFYGDWVMDEPNLHIPHIDLTNRLFVLEPMAELAPQMRDPRSGKTIGELLTALRRRLFFADLVVITNRHLCSGDFYEHMVRITACKPARIILREKDMAEDLYMAFASRMVSVCRTAGVPLSVHGRLSVAESLGIKDVHLTFQDYLRQSEAGRLSGFETVGVSIHGVREASGIAGADYAIFGHVFETDCKPDLPPRGLEKLKAVVAAATVPVYALGGIDRTRAEVVQAYGAEKYCMMSGAMQADIFKWFEG